MVRMQWPVKIFGVWSRVDYANSQKWIVLVLDERDKTPQQIQPDFDKCALCRAAKPHSQWLHEETVYTGHEMGETKQPSYVDDDRMEWEILNAEAENRHWSVTKPTEYTQQQIDAMWAGNDC